MSADQIFGWANSLALVSWMVLIGGPRWPLVTGALRWGVIGGLSILYAVLIAVFFFRVEGGGFFSLKAVQTLFANPNVALAGWIHYLAFDLFVGLWTAAKADALRLSRLVQAPILVATFMFGPFGYLLFLAVEAALRPVRDRLPA